MAVATTTALAIAGLAVTAGTTAGSFVQAKKQRKLQLQAEEEAATAINEAKKKLDVNYFDSLGINKESYALERDAMLVASAQAMDYSNQTSRGAGAGAGRVLMANNQGQQRIRTAQTNDVLELNKMSAMEDSRLAGELANIDIKEAEGAQLASRDAYEAANKAYAEGMEGVVSTAGQALSLMPLYAKTKSARQAKRLAKSRGGMQPLQSELGAMGNYQGVDFSGVNTMSPDQFTDFLSQQDPDFLKSLMNYKGTPQQQMLPTGDGLQVPIFEWEEPNPFFDY